MKKPKNVDEYIASAPENAQGMLKQLRQAIMEAAPEAEERISYGMPYYGYKGRLVYFRYNKDHIGIYLPTPVIEEHIEELQDYETAKATIRFPYTKDLPINLIKKLIKARKKKNQELK